MKLISILLALLNSLAAGFVLVMSLSQTELRQAEALWSLVKVLVALFVIAAGALTWRDGMRPVHQNLMLASGLILVALGAAVTVWTIHLAVLTGDMESYMVLYGASLVVQGSASVMGFVHKPGRPALF